MKTWRIRLAAAAVMLLIFGMVESVTFASGTIGNIARPVASGRATLGFDYENFEEEFKYEATLECPSCIPSSVTVPGKDKLKFSAPSFVGTYGLPDSPVEVGFLVGQLTINPEGDDLNLTGPKSGGFVRYAAQNPESLNFGLLLKVEGASVSSADYTGTYSAITAAFGISKDFGPAARLFGGAFGNQVDIKFDATDKILGKFDSHFGVPPGSFTSFIVKFTEKSNLGAFLGAEFASGEDLAAGAEIHGGNESGFGIYARLAL